MPDYISYTRDHYVDEETAATYARRQHIFGSPAEGFVSVLERRHVRSAIAAAGTNSYETVLDIPCGSGKLTKLLESVGSSYIAMDVSDAMVNILRQSFDGIVAIGDATQLPFPDDSIDLVVCLRLIHRVPAEVRVQIIRECVRVSRVAVVFSYAGGTRFPSLYGLLRRIARRPHTELSIVQSSMIAKEVESAGASVVYDKSTSFGVGSERLATISSSE